MLVNFVKVQVELIDFDGMSKSTADILNFWISQGIVAI